MAFLLKLVLGMDRFHLAASLLGSLQGLTQSV
jgi:hypothetical protein